MPKFVVDYSKDVPRPEDFPASDARLFSASAARNVEPIIQVVVPRLAEVAAAGAPRRLFEVGSGTGQHAVHLARALPDWVLQPSDFNPSHVASVAAWIAHEELANVAQPQHIDITAGHVPDEAVGAIMAVNVLHIAPFAVTCAILDCAAACLAPAGVLIVYGPFIRGETPLEPSNQSFDEDLRAENPTWGLRNTNEIAGEAASRGLNLAQIIPMPANNLLLVLEMAAG